MSHTSINSSIDDNSVEESNINDQNKINLKKIKYKIKNISYEEYIKNFTSGSHKANINCSYDFLVNQYGKPKITSTNQYNKIRASWYLKVITSNNYEYFFEIYDWDQTDIELKDVSEWNIGGNTETGKYLDYTKLIKLINYQFENFNKKQEKEEIKHTTNIQSQSETIIFENNKYNESKYIDINKYKEFDNEKLKKISSDDLACVLFTRFKELNNPLLKEALIIHRALEEPTNYNKLNINKNDQKKINNENNSFTIKRGKSKYNNKKDKTKYNDKK